MTKEDLQERVGELIKLAKAHGLWLAGSIVIEEYHPCPKCGGQASRCRCKSVVVADTAICSNCGDVAIRSGTCYLCHNCGTTSGCS